MNEGKEERKTYARKEGIKEKKRKEKLRKEGWKEWRKEKVRKVE